MSDRVMTDMRKSMEYVKVAQPILKKLLHGGEIMPVEGDDNEVCKMLDMTCGTDYFHVYADRGLVWGVASRVQEYDPDKDFCNKGPFNTFTIRKERASGARTELDKRRYAIKKGGVYPFLTMQAYINIKTGKIESLAVVKTTDLMEYIDKGSAEERHTGKDQHGQAAFLFVPWDALIKDGYNVLKYQAA